VEAFENDAYKNQKISVAFGADNPPDVFHTWGGGGLAARVRAGLVLPLPQPDAAQYYSSALEFCTVDGTLHALPADVGVVVFWYNTELFQQHGVKVPATWDELIQAVQLFRSKGITPIALGNRPRWTGALFFVYLVTRIAGTETFEKAAQASGGHTFAAAPFVEAGEKIRELIDAGAFSAGFKGAGYEDSRRELFTGRAAMMLMGTWLVASAKNEAPEFLEKMGAFPFPIVGGRDDNVVVGGVNAGYAVWSKTHHPQAAARLVRELAGKQAAQAWALTGRIPARTDVDLSVLPKPTQALLPILRQARKIQLYYDQYLPPQLKDEHLRTTAAIFDATMTPQEAAAAVAEAVSEYLESKKQK
jgi:raffinose/stachyose/melibiose transport system substrate-binding protein